MGSKSLVLGLFFCAAGAGATDSYADIAAPRKAPIGIRPVASREFDPEMTGAEYAPLIEDLLNAEEIPANPQLVAILAMGKRNLEWLDHINSLRDPAARFELSSAATQNGYPIDRPTYNNETLVLQRYSNWLASTPSSISSVLLTQVTYPDAPPVDDAQFLAIVRDFDKVYQNASRWLLQAPYLDEYATFQKNDIRGYYFLANEPNLAAELQNWAQQSADNQSRLSSLLVGQCFNADARSLADCQAELNQAVASGTVKLFFDAYKTIARNKYDSFFLIPVLRTDVSWTGSNPNLFSIPFRDPQNTAVVDWLRENIQDEWRLGNWQLVLNFVNTTDEGTTHIEFENGATPHVNDVAGSIITMDANRSLNEYSSRWTIRHEYGHVLGFPDCYIEFFDVTTHTMVNYQLDIDNLMCSRRGHLQQRHFDELRRVYFNAAL